MCKNCVKGMDFNSFKAVLIKKGEKYNFQAAVFLRILFNSGGDSSILSAVCVCNNLRGILWSIIQRDIISGDHFQLGAWEEREFSSLCNVKNKTISLLGFYQIPSSFLKQ